MTGTAYLRAQAAFDRGHLREALPLYHQALQESPENVEVMYRAMLTLMAMRDYSGCAKWLGELLPHVDHVNTPPWMLAGFYYNMGIAHEASGHWKEAARAMRRSLKYDPQGVLPTIELGSLAYREGLPADGERLHRKALTLEDDPESKPSRAFVKLLHGDYLGGFKDYEARWRLPQVLAVAHIPKNHFRWKGKPLGGKRIVIVAEQGVGDSIMMARYLPMIEARGGKVTLVVPGSLVSLMQYNYPSVDVVEVGKYYRPARWWAPMMSLPFIFGTTVETIPGYRLTAPTWKPRTLDRFRVGYVSQGNPLHMGDKDRSAPEGAFGRLLEVPGVEFVPLDEISLLTQYDCKDFADTAAIVQSLDLVISIDSAVGHLAGALGVPTWLCVPCAPEWRWGLKDTTPWYPNHTLYRRSAVTAWPELMNRIATDLETECLARRS